MLASIKAEFRKLITVRSTYVTLLFALAMMLLFAFWIEGYKAGGSVISTDKLANLVNVATGALVMLGALVCILQVSHEFKFNTIMYTLTASRSRVQWFLAKLLVLSAFLTFFTVFVFLVAPALTYLGVAMSGSHMVHQTFPLWDLFWRSWFYTWGFGIFALLVTLLVRHQVGSIVIMFLVPSTLETLLGLLLKKNAIYLPFNVLTRVLDGGATAASSPAASAHLAVGAAALIFLGYLVVLGTATGAIFVKRDAN